MEDEVRRPEEHEDLEDDLDPDDVAREEAVPGELRGLVPIHPIGPGRVAAAREE